MPDYDVIIIGAGHNGLVTACYLAKAGLKTLVLERRKIVGGAAVTEEIHPGFRCSTLAHLAAPFSPQIIKDLQLTRHGLEIIKPPVQLIALSTDGPALGIYHDTEQT
ncbi:MAG TPA: FAD-dependent oxidoreductase, partial [Pyrinomonadaceae bacterium]|nr:FAD-dependent oxidoreductase [Pyrinomonadaceae bacterium]